jgi:hypothetical protein
MSINAKLLEQDKLIREQCEAIKKLKSALKMVLRPSDDGCDEDGCKLKATQSDLSDIIDHHNSMISECKDEIDGILILLDLEF